MTKWKEYKLDEVIEKFIDYRGKTPKKCLFGIPLITAKIIKNNSILEPNEFISQEDYADWMTRGFPKANDVLLTTEAPLGEVALLKNEKVALAQRIILLRGKQNILNNFFLFYSFQSKLMQYRLKSRASGSTVQGIKSSELKKIEIPLPSLKEQEQISLILSVLDNKIDLLRRQNETLEKIAQTLFKHWFIDFEFPNQQGKPYKSSGGKMVDSELGKIPEGWIAGKLMDFGVNKKLIIHKNDISLDMPYIALEHMPKKSICLGSWIQAKDVKSNKFVFDKTDILFGKLRPYFHKVGISFTSGICSTDILVITPKKPNCLGYLLMIISSEFFIQYVSKACEGTRMPRTNWKYMSNYKVRIPADEICNRFNKFIISIMKKMDNNIHQIQTLTKTRDTLLPKLMSGQIRIPSDEDLANEPK